MINEPIKIINLESLQREKQRLKMFCSYQEELISDKVNFIKYNYKTIIAEEFLPYNKDENKKVSGVLDMANEFVFGKFIGLDLDGKNKLAGALIKMVEVGAVKLFNSFKKKSN
jgi:hypothetical protein